ncbi:uncharacterized protein [Linepithema humile]|nr:PREDICTED: putative uncharacterized protein DDB_G0285119 isoform X2 [Linepithema humile]XP_012232752.1 PREDICTED: putative uncharacterized protein DDB_G0285119 isoform X2 [Linepithema humile]
MKMLLIAIALLVAVEAKAYQWATYGPNIQTGRGNNPPRGPTWMQQQNQNNIFGPDVEWVCQNPKTNDLMIIAADNTQHRHPGRGPWQNVPPGHQKHQQYWPQPIIIVEERPDNNQISPSPPLDNNNNINNNNNNNDNQPQTTPHYHGGEGLIDVRMGA